MRDEIYVCRESQRGIICGSCGEARSFQEERRRRRQSARRVKEKKKSVRPIVFTSRFSRRSLLTIERRLAGFSRVLQGRDSLSAVSVVFTRQHPDVAAAFAFPAAPREKVSSRKSLSIRFLLPQSHLRFPDEIEPER